MKLRLTISQQELASLTNALRISHGEWIAVFVEHRMHTVTTGNMIRARNALKLPLDYIEFVYDPDKEYLKELNKL